MYSVQVLKAVDFKDEIAELPGMDLQRATKTCTGWISIMVLKPMLLHQQRVRIETYPA